MDWMITGLGAAALFCLAWLAGRQPARHMLALFDAGLAGLAGGLLAARAGFVAVHWAYYQTNPLEIPQFWQGGLDGAWAPLGVALGLAMSSRFGRRSGHNLDALLPVWAVLAVGGWLVAWQAWQIDPSNLTHPAIPLTGAGATLSLFWLLDLSRTRFAWLRAAGRGSALALLGLSLGLLGLALLPTSTPTWTGHPPTFWAGLSSALLGLGWLLYLHFIPHPPAHKEGAQ